jgi:transcriptional regulator with XRE-family HTH domain
VQRNNLKQIRIDKGLSQLELSRKSGVPGNIISNIENGKVYPYPGWRKKIVKALGMIEEVVFPYNNSLTPILKEAETDLNEEEELNNDH